MSGKNNNHSQKISVQSDNIRFLFNRINAEIAATFIGTE